MKKHRPDMIGPWAKENGLDHIAKLYDPYWKPKRKRDSDFKLKRRPDNKGKHR